MNTPFQNNDILIGNSTPQDCSGIPPGPAGYVLGSDGTTWLAVPVSNNGQQVNMPLTALRQLLLGDAGKLVTNKGASGPASGRIITLPATSVATINGIFYSLWYDFVDYAGVGLQIACNAGQFIAIGDLENMTADGGYINNRFQYNKTRLTLLDSGVWVATPDPNWLTN